MKITVNKDNVKIEEFDVVHEGEHRVNKCSFSFSEEYTEELVKKAIFTSQNSSVEVAIINNECNIPTEILKARNIVLLGVYAYKVVDDKLDLRYSPSPDAFKVNSGSYIEGANESEEITSSQFEQYMQAMNDGLNKVEESIKKMDEATSSANDLVDNINQKLENGDFIGPEGKQGPQGIPGKDGVNGQDGIGITTITSGQSTVEEDKTITPVTVNKTDGSSQIFKVEAKNGLDGKDGLNGKDGVNGQNGQDGTTPNIQIGTVETLEPNEQATVTRTGTDEEPVFNFGIPKGQQGEKGLDGTNGTDGKDATINSQNTVEITTDNNITLDQQESMLKLGLNSQLILKQDAEGTDNVFNDGLKSPLYDLGGDGKSEQETTDGSQLIDFANPEQKSSTTSFSFENGVLNVSSTPGGTYQNIAWNITNIIKSNTGKTLKYKDKTHSVTNENILSMAQLIIRYNDDTPTLYHILCNYRTDGLNSFQIPNDVANIREAVFGVYSNNTADTNITNSVTVEEPLLYFDNNDSYEPYTGGQPSPGPDYPQEINSIEGSLEFACRGKNLLKPLLLDNNILNGITSNTLDDGSISLNGTSTSDTYRSIATTNLKANTDYTLSVDSDTTNDIQIFCNVTPTESGTNWIPINNKYTIFRVNNDIQNAIINIFIRNNTTVNKVFKVQLEQGTTATEYEPYIEPNKVTFNLGQEKLRSVGDVKDELVVDLDTGDYYKVENIGEKYFTNEVWTRGGNNRGFYTTYFENEIVPYGKINSNSYKYAKSVWEDNYTISINSQGYIAITDERFTSSDDFKNWLLLNNVMINYELKTPTTKKLGTLSAEDLAKLKTFKGYNNVTVNTNLGLMNIRFTYGLDIKKYVDNKIAELSAQLIKGE